MALLKVFILALLISFIGSLPLGSVNVTAFQLSASTGIAAATWFVAGSLLAETLYVRLTLTLMDHIMQYSRFLKALHWISFVVMLALAIMSFVAAEKTISEISGPIIPQQVHPLIAGFLMMAINPVQIPFWAGWSTVLFEKQIMQRHVTHYNIFTLGAAAGALAASIVFVYAGQLLMSSHHTAQKTINIMIGSVFLVMAGVQAVRMMRDQPSN